jgi:hypothetical protein
MQTFDFAPDSLLSTSMLGWYTGVVHEMKPITSGYRLALVYNVILTADVPRPRLPNIGAANAELHTVLRKWILCKYPQHPGIKVVAYLFKRRYSMDILTMAKLRGQDRHKVSHLRSIVAALGYVVDLANLEYWVRGYPAGYGEYDDEYDDGDVRIAKVIKTSVSIQGLVDLDGAHIPGLQKLPLKEENLIPEDPFAEVGPDKTEYDFVSASLTMSDQKSHWCSSTRSQAVCR